MQVILQLPILVAEPDGHPDGVLRMFRRVTEMALPPVRGMPVSGLNMPDVLNKGEERKVKNIINEVGENLDTNEVHVTLFASREVAYTADEYLIELNSQGHEWTLVEGIVMENPSSQSLEGPEEGYGGE